MKNVYVIYDPLYEKVLCVHDEEDMECEICKPIRDERWKKGGPYFLQSHECEIKYSKEKIRDNQIDKIL